MAVRSLCRLHGLWCLPASHISGRPSRWTGGGFDLAYTSSSEGVYFCLVVIVESVAYKIKSSGSRYYSRRWCGLSTKVCAHMETSQHLLLSCDFYGLLWQAVRSWLGVSGPDPHNISDHWYQFAHSTGGSRAKRSFMQLVWLLCAWTIWNDRNNRLFNNVESSIDKLLDKIKHYSLWWLKASNTNFVFGFTSWWSTLSYVWTLANWCVALYECFFRNFLGTSCASETS